MLPHIQLLNGMDFRWYKLFQSLESFYGKNKAASPAEFRFHIVLSVFSAVGKKFFNKLFTQVKIFDQKRIELKPYMDT